MPLKSKQMFELSDESPRPWMLFVFHCGVVLFGVPLLGLANYWITPLVGAGLATYITRGLKDRSAVFAWIPACLLFLWGAYGTISSWSPKWSAKTHWQYVTNTLFGPNCGDSECIGLLVTAMFTGGVGYSVGAYFVLRRSKGVSKPTP
jgi:hypothetical protein